MAAVAASGLAGAKPYPWIYRPSPSARAWLIAAGLLLIGLFAAMGWLAYIGQELTAPLAKVSVLGGCGALALLGLYGIQASFTSATVLYAEGVERRDLFYRRRMRREDIAGYRITRTQNSFPRMKLKAKPFGGKDMSLTLYQPDDAFEAWFEGIPDLNFEDFQKAEQAVLDDPDFGATVEQRRKTLQLLHRLGGVADWIGIGLFVWIFAWPRPYQVAILVGLLAPLAALALVALSRGRFALWSSDLRPKVGWLMYPGLAVALRALQDIHLYHWQGIIAPAMVVGVVAAFLSWAVDRRIAEKPLILGLFALLSLAYAYGVATEADALLDRSKARIFPTMVLGIHISSGKHTSYDVELAPWGDRHAPEEIDVGRRTYDRLAIGQPACAYLWEGRIGVSWFLVDRCPRPPPPRLVTRIEAIPPPPGPRSTR